ncbi:MAG TPA: hypothetical protein VGC02_04895 [Methanobacterium sp.]
MGEVLGVNLQRGEIDPWKEDQVGVFLGIKRDVPVTPSPQTEGNTSFVLPAGNVPYMDTDLDGEVDVGDVKLTDEGVLIPVTSFTPATRTAVATTAPESGSIIKARFTELMEAVILTDHNLASKMKELKWGMARSSKETTVYTGEDDTLDMTLKVKGSEIIKLLFDPVTGEKLDIPPNVSVAVVHFKRKESEKDWGFFCEDSDLIFEGLSKGKALDFIEQTAKISLKSVLKYFEVDDYLLSAGITPP